MNKDDYQKIYSKIVAKAWKDPDFKALLLKNPESALRSLGVEVPQGIKVVTYENTESQFCFVLPQPPPGALALSDEELETIAAGEALNPLHQDRIVRRPHIGL